MQKGNGKLITIITRRQFSISKTTNDEDFIAESSLGLAKQYALLNRNDSSNFMQKSYELSERNGFLSRQLDASVFLNQHYKNQVT